jgi:hypothetical protein
MTSCAAIAMGIRAECVTTEMLTLFFAAVSLLYATVGQAGGTAFLALMTFASYRKSGDIHSASARYCFRLLKRGAELVQISKLSFIANSFLRFG